MRRMGLALALGAAAWAPAGAEIADLVVPTFRAPEERRDSEFRKAPSGGDLHDLVRHLENCIASKDVLPKNIPGIDLFLSKLERALRLGSDAPRDNILRNAQKARETLRAGYNELSSAESPPLLSSARDTLQRVSAELGPLLNKNRGSVLVLRSVSDTAQQTSAAMTLEPPGSPGSEVPVARLCAISSIEPELKALRERLREAAKSVQQAKALVLQAQERESLTETLAQKAGLLDESAVGHLNERRTRGEPVRYQNPIQSREVIQNANFWLKRAVDEAVEVVGMLESQLDPSQEGIRKAVDLALAADVKTQNAKVLEEQSGQRINFNHALRLNDAIYNGWRVAAARRKPWWVGRARLAKGEAIEDSSKMTDAWGEAQQAAQAAESQLQTSLSAIARLDRLLGAGEGRRELAERPSVVPPPRITSRPAPAVPEQVRSKGLKIPHTLNVSAQEIISAFDGRGN